ncbi:MAG: hypothetical protein GTN40_01675, partial [Candidatus Aenigmarchaeota archaeon]|nr:hypothetical protein [Candidatus Aenigmarchaeota archaeon]
MSGVRSPNSIKISFYTLGCRLNQAETEKMVKEAMSRNFYVVDFRNKADIYIINTCSVTALADR